MTTVMAGHAAGAPFTGQTELTLEMGPHEDDSLVIAGGFQQVAGTYNPTDEDLAIVGGTGHFTGAEGDVHLDTNEDAVLTIWVPRHPSF